MNFFTSIMASVAGALGGPLTSVTDTGTALISFFTGLTDGKLWRSLGWLILGIMLMMIGLNWLLKDQQLKVVGGVAKAAAKVVA